MEGDPIERTARFAPGRAAVKCEIASSASGAPSPKRVRGLLERIAKVAPSGEREVSVLFCGDRRMRSLNRRYRGMDRSTDVLSFPASGTPGFLGDIVISVPYAARQARRGRGALVRELDRLLLHGFLHLLGYDHETDEGEMEALESRLRRRLRLAEKETGQPRSPSSKRRRSSRVRA